jgi:phage terminase small subunit
MKIEQIKSPQVQNQRKTSAPKSFTSTKPLTHKQKIFVKEYVDNGGNGTKAAEKAYGVTTNGSARQIASENLTKPNIIMALGQHNDLVESAIIGTVRDWKDSDKPRQREIALDAAKFAHDKIHGKARQAVDISQKTVSISLNLAGDGELPPADMLQG